MPGKLQGIFCPNMVPLDDAGRAINESELARLIDYLIEKGVTGLYPNGSTGEFVRLDYPERRRVIEIACDRAKRAGREVPVLAGAYEAHIDLTVDTMNYYADLGCRAGAIIAPYYFKMSQDSVHQYFEELADRSRLPVVMYNIPQFANEISIPTIVSLCKHPNIVGIKDSQRDLPRYMNTISKIRPIRPDFSFLIGCEEILLPSLLMGGDGGTIATSGVVPEMIMRLYNNFREGRIAEATKIQYQMLELIEVMLTGADFPEGFRAGMSVRGFQMGKGRQHQSSSSQLNISRITNVIQCLISEHGLVNPPASGCPVPGSDSVDANTVKEIVARVMASLGR
ncbi:MAG: dihydrodipicolinate synthase family protein [Phycisphaeraceae bacterium]|nr:dihydrodipicolinate synthase family protein [Phycisphaeraceae bacterium]